MIAFLSRAYCAPLVLLTVVAWSAATAATAAANVLINPVPSPVIAHDNRKPAGSLQGDVLTLSLRAGRGVWQPEGPAGPAVTVEALGETASPLSVPAPMIRVPEGTTIAASVRNDLEEALLIRGLCARDGSPCAPLSVPAGETRRIEFKAGQPGTYHYWATTMGVPVPFREMGGAFIVDPREGAVPDRVLVITEWSNLSRQQIGDIITADVPGEAFGKANPRFVFVINGLSWPSSERMTYQVGETVRWRVINLSSQHHPMHLHGFYFNVESAGNGLRDQPVADANRHAVVTHLLRSDATMVMTWTPEREGNWLFHCHIMHHVSPERRFVETTSRAAEAHESHAGHDAGDPSGGMAGMIIGVTVVKPAAAATKVPMPETVRAPRRLTLDMVRDFSAPDARFGFALAGDGVAAAATASRVSSPGPVLILRRNEPVEITVRNQLGESTAVHWHGMELDSIYDGVHGFSGVGKKRSPMIEPGESFVVRFTPPRTGTFIYHTHLHDHRQLPLGLYGAMIVVDGDATFDPDVDHVVVLGRSGLDPAVPDVVFPTIPVVINGETGPRSVWKAGRRHRIRLINITPDDILVVAMESAQGLTKWQPVSKDGTPLPEGLRAKAPARQTIAVGETYDFEIELPPFPQNLWLDVRSTGGKWHAQAQVIVK